MSKVTEIPLGKRTKKYRFFEMLPAILSYSMIILLFLLSIISPIIGSVYVLFVVVMMLVKAAGIAVRTLQGNRVVKSAMKVNWRKRLDDLSNPEEALKKTKKNINNTYNAKEHIANLENIIANPSEFPKPNDIYHIVIVTMYDEGLETMVPTFDSLLESDFDLSRMIVFLAYEERGGEQTKHNAETLYKKYQNSFCDMVLSEHPANISNEVVGKGANLTYAGGKISEYVKKKSIDISNVIITTLDSDNHPHKSYFSIVAYEFIVHEERNNLSYQPVSLFTNNIWDAPAMMRIIAISNSFWNLICTMRPHVLRNFASHSQPLKALQGMNYWSKRTIVEDGHQYWRSLFYFEGNYATLPIRVPIYQDAVLSDTIWRTMKAQFIQLRRWDYGASDVAYVGNYLFSKERRVRLLSLIPKFVRLIDSHVTLAATAPIVVFGGWVPLLFSLQSRAMVVHFLPTLVGIVQTVGSIGLIITILLSLRLIPPRPKHYPWWRSILMVAQWVLMPLVSIIYSSCAAFYSQTRLFLGLYMENFDVTKKTVKH
ncbi:hypothetical protein IIY59_01330 [Candidatus Saccharibacteria bacterium]|nr:hypothetical protein [Candidatus Saccharibacteria bacterium]